MKTRKKLTIVFLVTLVVAICIVFTIRHNRLILSRAMLSHDLGVMYQAITRIIIRQIPQDKQNIETE